MVLRGCAIRPHHERIRCIGWTHTLTDTARLRAPKCATATRRLGSPKSSGVGAPSVTSISFLAACCRARIGDLHSRKCLSFQLNPHTYDAVSYTHLTLPTIYSV